MDSMHCDLSLNVPEIITRSFSDETDTHRFVVESFNSESHSSLRNCSFSEESQMSDCSTSNDDNYESYKFRAKICTRLSRELNLDEIQYDFAGEWTPPEDAGLQNCDAILPAYYHYHKYPHKIQDIDYYEIIKDDIRNFRVLNKYQLKYISELPDELKTELFILFNQCTNTMNTLLESTK